MTNTLFPYTTLFRSGWFDRRDPRGHLNRLDRQAEQARIAAQLPAHEHRRTDAIPFLGLERLDEARWCLQARGHLGHAQPGGFARGAQAPATSVFAVRQPLVGRHHLLLPPSWLVPDCGNSARTRRTYQHAAALSPIFSSIFAAINTPAYVP